jgi:hypothetical protein
MDRKSQKIGECVVIYKLMAASLFTVDQWRGLFGFEAIKFSYL